MTKAELVEKVSDKVNGLTKKQTEVIINTVFDSIKGALANGAIMAGYICPEGQRHHAISRNGPAHAKRTEDFHGHSPDHPGHRTRPRPFVA